MKNFLKKIVVFIITIEAWFILKIYRPKIIAVTGSVGKTSTKDMIFSVLSKSFHVRKNNKSMNSEIGVPLTIIGADSGWNSLWMWISIIFIGLWRIIYSPSYPEWLVLEVGIDHPGDMKRTASWIKPFCAVFTAFGDVPVHVEFFGGPEDVIREKSELLKYVRPNGSIILNQDDENVIKLKHISHVKTFTYSFEEEADIFATNYQVNYSDNGVGGKIPTGISFKLNYSGNVLPITINKVIGEQHIYSALPAISVAIALGAPLVPASIGLSEHIPPVGRMNIIEGENGAIIIDDTYNASPIAMKKAIEALAMVSTGGTKIAVLGDMLELGRFSHNEHKKIGEMLKKTGIDILISVGLRAETIAESAHEFGMAKKNIYVVKKSSDAIEIVNKFLSPGNVFLVKGSQGMRMERIVESVMAHPEEKEKLLVRQEKEWILRA